MLPKLGTARRAGSANANASRLNRSKMEIRHKILLVDDDPDLLEVYRETIEMLPSGPEIQTASSGARRSR